MSRRDKDGSQVFCLSHWKGGVIICRDGGAIGRGGFVCGYVRGVQAFTCEACGV